MPLQIREGYFNIQPTVGIGSRNLYLEGAYSMEELARFKAIVLSGAHKHDDALGNEILKRLVKSLMNSACELSVDFAPYFKAMIDETDFVLSDLQCMHHEKFLLYQNSILRLLVVDSLETMQCLSQHIKEWLNIQSLFSQNVQEKLALQGLQKMVQFICAIRWSQLKSQSALDKEATVQLLLEGVSIFFNISTAAVAPFLVKVAAMPASVLPALPITVSVAESSYSAGRMYYQLRAQAHLNVQRVSTYVKNVINHNKVKFALGILAFVGVSVASMMFAPVAFVTMLAMIVYSGVRMTQTIMQRVKANQQAAALVDEQMQATLRFKEIVLAEPVKKVSLPLIQKVLTLKEELAMDPAVKQASATDWVLSEETRSAYRHLHIRSVKVPSMVSSAPQSVSFSSFNHH